MSMTMKKLAQPYPDTTAEVQTLLEDVATAIATPIAATAAAPVTATTAELAAIGDAINTTDKVVGKMVWNTTLGQPVWADGATAGDTWSLSTGVVAHTPI